MPPKTMPEMPPPPPIGGFQRRQKRGGIFGWYDGLSTKKQNHLSSIMIYFFVGIFVLVPMFFCGIYTLRGWMFPEEEVVAETSEEKLPAAESADVVSLKATISAMTSSSEVAETKPEEAALVLMPTNTATPPSEAEIAATATAHYQYNRPINPPVATGSKMMIGVVRLDGDFGFCSFTNLGFVAGGQPYFLHLTLDQIPETTDANNKLLMIVGVVESAPNCEYPLIQVWDAKWVAQATPEPIRYAPEHTTTMTTSMYIRPTPDIPLVAPSPSNEYLAQYPMNGPDGQPLPTASPTAAAMVNFYGTIQQAEGCWDSSFSLATTGGEYILIFDGADLPSGAEPFGKQAYIQGQPTTACDRLALRVKASQYIPTVTPPPTTAPKADSPSHTPTPTATPIKMTISGQFKAAAAGCEITSYGIQTDSRFAYLLFDSLSLPTEGDTITIRGFLDESICPMDALRVVDFAIATPTPTPTGEKHEDLGLDQWGGADEELR